MADCYPADHCLSSLLADYQAAGGICQGSFLDIYYPGDFPVTDSCEVDPYYPYSVLTGLCSEQTQELLRDQDNCVIPIFSQKESIYLTTRELIYSMCDYQTYDAFWPEILSRKVNAKDKRKSETRDPGQRSQPDHCTMVNIRGS